MPFRLIENCPAEAELGSRAVGVAAGMAAVRGRYVGSGLGKVGLMRGTETDKSEAEGLVMCGLPTKRAAGSTKRNVVQAPEIV